MLHFRRDPSILEALQHLARSAIPLRFTNPILETLEIGIDPLHLVQVSRALVLQNAIREAGPPHAKVLSHRDSVGIHARHGGVGIGQSIDPFLDSNIFVAGLDTSNTGQSLGNIFASRKVAGREESLAGPLFAVLEHVERKGTAVLERHEGNVSVAQGEAEDTSAVGGNVWHIRAANEIFVVRTGDENRPHKLRVRVRRRSHTIQIGVNTTFAIGVVSCVLVIKVGQTEIVVDAAIDEMAKSWNGVCNLKDADTSPKLVRLVNSEAYNTLASQTILDENGNLLTISVDKDAVAVLKSSLDGIKIHE